MIDGEVKVKLVKLLIDTGAESSILSKKKCEEIGSIDPAIKNSDSNGRWPTR